MEERGEILIYQSNDGITNIEVKMQDETVWLSQQQMAELFQTSRTNVVEHIQNIYNEAELDEASTCRKFRQVRTEFNNLVSGYFDFAEISAIEHRPMYMSDYISQLDSILTSGNRPLLEGNGKVSHADAIFKAKGEYKKYIAENLSPVEKAYIDTITEAGKAAKTGIRKSKG